ncbi:chemotaxis protein CheW [Inediibacterium massiliense]|uniref:chemotaxis protein CheW n=1 Tax=Inediibacterium massiliense TaxID=1658111 RepID=UPI0006B53008|nr:chemotaxis protein CheW [Inediibacterium massiliense]
MNQNQFVIFVLEDEEYAIDISKVKEINRLKDIAIHKIPKAPYYIEGMINLRGVLVPVVNIRRKLGLNGYEITKKSRIIVINSNGQNVGLLVDGVSCVEEFDPSCINSSLDEMNIHYDYIAGVIKKEKRMLFYIDIEKIFHV